MLVGVAHRRRIVLGRYLGQLVTRGPAPSTLGARLVRPILRGLFAVLAVARPALVLALWLLPIV
jgi:hypothetical protein